MKGRCPDPSAATVGAAGGGAGDGTRTRDNLLGRQALYQLSYSRELVGRVADETPHP